MIPIIILTIENDDEREFMISLYEDFSPVMKALAMEIVKDSSIAEDIIHDAFASLIPKVKILRQFEHRVLKSYISRAVRNKALDYCQRQQREIKHTADILEEECLEITSDTEPSMQERFEMRDEYFRLGRALMNLPDRERELLLQKYLSKMSDESIGVSLGIKKESVRTYLTRARRMLKEYLLRGCNP